MQDTRPFARLGSALLVALALGCGSGSDSPAGPSDAARPLVDAGASEPSDAGSSVEEPGGPVSFSADVWPILEAHCSMCHATLTLGGLRYGTTPEEAHAALVEVPTFHGAACPLPYRVTPFEPEASLLFRAIDHRVPEGCGLPMPYAPNEPLSPRERGVVRAWIARGALAD